MIDKLKKAGIGIIVVPAFFLYFTSESILRQAAVSNITPKKVDVDAMIADLPAPFRDKVLYRYELGKLRDSVSYARSDSERAFTTLNLATFIEDEDEKNKLYLKVLKEYPDEKESVRAYLYFFMNPDTETKVSIKEFHKFISSLPERDRLFIWQNGLGKLVADSKNDPKLKYQYLLPLLDYKPPFREYFSLYRDLLNLCEELDKPEEAKKARKLMNSCNELPLIETFEMEKKSGK